MSRVSDDKLRRDFLLTVGDISHQFYTIWQQHIQFTSIKETNSSYLCLHRHRKGRHCQTTSCGRLTWVDICRYCHPPHPTTPPHPNPLHTLVLTPCEMNKNNGMNKMEWRIPFPKHRNNSGFGPERDNLGTLRRIAGLFRGHRCSPCIEPTISSRSWRQGGEEKGGGERRRGRERWKEEINIIKN